MTDDLNRLRAVAEVATPGPWEQEPNTMAGRVWVRTAWNSDLEPNTLGKFFQWRRLFAVRTYRESHAKTPEQVYRQREADARHIATFDPPTVLALLDRIERAETERDLLQTEVNTWIENDQISFARATRLDDEITDLRAAVTNLADQLHADAEAIRRSTGDFEDSDPLHACAYRVAALLASAPTETEGENT